jgi:DNA primase
LSFITLPAGQDPDDLVRSGGRPALDALLEHTEPLVDRLWRHEVTVAPLTTPESKAGLKKRLLDHVASIENGDVRDQYRHELLERFNLLTRPKRTAWLPREHWQKGQGSSRFQPRQPASEGAKAVGQGGLWGQTGRAVLQGLLRFPELIPAHAEAIAALPLTERPVARLRDSLLDAAMIHGTLDQERLNTILAQSGAASLAEKLRLERGLAFSFTRRDIDSERACRDLVLVIDTLAAQPGLDAALAAATVRLKDRGDEAAFQEQQRLRAARDEADRQLAALIESDAAERE